MELDDLLKKEGLDAAGLEDALAWARRRAAELVRDVDRDPELGPLLDGVTLVAADVEGARVVDPVVVHAPAEPAWREDPPAPEREPEPVVDEASPVVAAPDEPPAVADDHAAAEQGERSTAEPEESSPRPASEPDAARLRSGSGPVGASARSETSQARPMFSDLRGLQAAFLAESDDEDDELPEVGAVLRAFQKGKSRSVRSASGSVRAAAATPAEAIEPRAKPASAPQEVVPAEGGPREPDAPVPRRRATPDVMPHQASAELVAARPAAGAPDDLEVRPDPVEALAALDADAPGETEATVPGARPPVAPDEPPAASAVVDHGLPAPPEADLDPLAGIDFDDLPGVDEDDEEEDHTHVDLPLPPGVAAAIAEPELESRTTMVPMDGPDLTLPSMQVPLADLMRARTDGPIPSSELTERVLNPLLPAEPTGEVTVTAMTPSPLGEDIPAPPASDVTVPTPVVAEPAEEPAEDIELLDDEDLLLVEEVEEESEPQDDEDELPEWKRALLESKADEDG